MMQSRGSLYMPFIYLISLSSVGLIWWAFTVDWARFHGWVEQAVWWFNSSYGWPVMCSIYLTQWKLIRNKHRLDDGRNICRDMKLISVFLKALYDVILCKISLMPLLPINADKNPSVCYSLKAMVCQCANSHCGRRLIFIMEIYI